MKGKTAAEAYASASKTRVVISVIMFALLIALAFSL